MDVLLRHAFFALPHGARAESEPEAMFELMTRRVMSSSAETRDDLQCLTPSDSANDLWMHQH